MVQIEPQGSPKSCCLGRFEHEECVARQVLKARRNELIDCYLKECDVQSFSKRYDWQSVSREQDDCRTIGWSKEGCI